MLAKHEQGLQLMHSFWTVRLTFKREFSLAMPVRDAEEDKGESSQKDSDSWHKGRLDEHIIDSVYEVLKIPTRLSGLPTPEQQNFANKPSTCLPGATFAYSQLGLSGSLLCKAPHGGNAARRACLNGQSRLTEEQLRGSRPDTRPDVAVADIV